MKLGATVMLCLLFIAQASLAANIVLVYPRSETSLHPHGYAANLDSSFVLGRVEPPAGELSVNGTPVSLDERGAFLAWLPLRKSGGERSWDLVLRQNGTQIATMSLPYAIASDTIAASTRDTFRLADFPRVIRVMSPNTHLRTALNGTYHVFPDSGCLLLAVGHASGYYRVKLCDGLYDYVEDSVITRESGAALAPAILGNGGCETQKNLSVCSLALERSVPGHRDLFRSEDLESHAVRRRCGDQPNPL